MQANLIGVVSVYLLHAIAMIFLFPPKYRWSKAAAIWGSMIVVFTTLCFLIFSLMPNYIGIALALGITAAMGIITSLRLSSYDVSKTLFLFLTYTHVFVIILYASKVLSLYFFEDNQTVMIVIRTIFHIVLVFSSIAFVRSKFGSISQDIEKGWWPLNFVVFLLFISGSNFAISSFTTGYAGDDVLPFLLMVLISVAIYGLFFHTIYYMNTAKETEKMELQSKFLMQQVADMQESIETAKRIRHDARHHNMQVIEYAEKGEFDELLSYLGEYERELESHVFVTLCENHAANSILNVYTRKAKQQGIEVRLDVTLEENIIISDTDLVAMLGNLMENAINGCMQPGISAPFIELHIGRKASKLTIYIRNSAGDDVSLENGLPKSKSGDSIGVSSILHSAARYGGEYDFRIKEGVFSCQLLLKMREKNTRSGSILNP